MVNSSALFVATSSTMTRIEWIYPGICRFSPILNDIKWLVLYGYANFPILLRINKAQIWKRMSFESHVTLKMVPCHHHAQSQLFLKASARGVRYEFIPDECVSFKNALSLTLIIARAGKNFNGHYTSIQLTVAPIISSSSLLSCMRAYAKKLPHAPHSNWLTSTIKYKFIWPRTHNKISWHTNRVPSILKMRFTTFSFIIFFTSESKYFVYILCPLDWLACHYVCSIVTICSEPPALRATA